MKGVVFTELFEFVEEHYSPEFLQEVINESELKNNGAYASTGTYSACEVGVLVGTLSHKTKLGTPELLKLFGKHLFSVFSAGYAEFLTSAKDAFSFLESVETHIHTEVLKLYPDAELPNFEIIEHGKDLFVMRYKSSRHLGDLCEGLIIGCLEYFSEEAEISRKVISEGQISIIDFELKRVADVS